MAVLETVARNAACNAIVDLLDSGTLVFETSADGEVATLSFSATAFGAASSGTASANEIFDDTSAAGGTVAQASLYTSASAKVMECTVGTGGAEINLSSLTVGAGDTVSCSALSITVPAS
jgi:hypothetical protein